ncbi:hypothetical protein [Leeuwenhoekiella sp. CH_XMU1409-2]|uniref:hypothetical protein n=1 Tax=Leeuwenhoekiella sp. CH_XMU1409-2 TaxID=3107768 RepID=UPI0030086163
MRKDTIKLNPSEGKVNGKFQIINFWEGDFFILYIPSLQMSSYGKDEKEAHLMMRETLQDFFESLNIKKGTDLFYKTMRELGWSRDRYFKKKLSVDLSDTTYDDIKKEFNLPDDVELSTAEMAV